jgi:hypothetical protein
MANGRDRPDFFEGEAHGADRHPVIAAERRRFGEAQPIEGLDADDDFLDVVLDEEPRQVAEPSQHRHAFEAQPALGRIVVDEAERREGVRSILEERAYEQRPSGAGAVDQDRPSHPALPPQILVGRADRHPCADEEEHQDHRVDGKDQPREPLKAIGEIEDRERRGGDANPDALDDADELARAQGPPDLAVFARDRQSRHLAGEHQRERRREVGQKVRERLALKAKAE